MTEAVDRVGPIPVDCRRLVSPQHLSDSPGVRLGVLAAIAAYERESRVVLSAVELDRDRLRLWGDFLSFAISYPAEQSWNVHFEAEKHMAPTIHERSESCSLLVSGGLDSTAALLYLRARGTEPRCVWVDYGQPYAEIERAAALDLQRALRFELQTIHVELEPWIVKGYERFQHVVPARNVLLASLAEATNHSRQVCIVALAGEEKVPDKSPRFYSDLTRLLDAEVFSPFSRGTKSQVVAWWLRSGFEIGPERTVSCYSPEGPCGRCRACVKRAIAFSANGIQVPMAENPWADDNQVLSRYHLQRFADFDAARRADTLLAMRNAWSLLGATGRSFVTSVLRTDPSVLDMIGRRRHELAQWAPT